MQVTCYQKKKKLKTWKNSKKNVYNEPRYFLYILHKQLLQMYLFNVSWFKFSTSDFYGTY